MLIYMSRIRLLLYALSMLFLKAQGQCIVHQEKDGLLLTTCDVYSSGKTNVYHQVTYLGNPFLTFPIWQEGQIRLDRSGKSLDCQLAYNLHTNEVLCRFVGDSTVKTITPEVFIINNTEFVRQRNILAGMDYRLYYSIIHNGPTKLLQSLSSQIEPMNSAEEINSRYYRDLIIKGVCRTKTSYYIQKGDGDPKLITLSKKSLLNALADQSQALESKVPARQPLTINNVIDILNYYDSLVVVARKNELHVSRSDVFKQILQHKITYPGWVGNQGIYGRVYAGFDIDSLGLVNNIVILSPDNVGFGFIYAVKKALETLSNVDPAFKGKYALPVAFTYTNSKENTGPHVPLNHLPDDRLNGRTLLQETVVPFVITQPVTSSREVWGYYK